MTTSKLFQYDVTISGAGPSGATLAWELARKGIKVLLLEKHKLPHQKVCAGGITVRAASILPINFDEVIENVIYGVRLSFKTVPKKVRTYDKPLAYMVRRDRFDNLLACRAREAGVKLEEGVELKNIQIHDDFVTVTTNQYSFSTPVLVGADGANSAVINSLGLKKGFEYGFGVNGNIPVTDEVFYQWDKLIGLDYGIAGGYAWIFPKQKYLAVGAGGPIRKVKILKSYTLRLINSYKLNSRDNVLIKGHPMPIKREKTPLTYQRVLLVGDAAGLIDPLTGEGLFYGIKSSLLAANSIARFLKRETTSLDDYDKAVNLEIMPELKVASTIHKLNTLAPRLFFHYFQENDRFWRAFCCLLRGERTYQGLKNSLNPPLKLIFKCFE